MGGPTRSAATALVAGALLTACAAPGANGTPATPERKADAPMRHGVAGSVDTAVPPSPTTAPGQRIVAKMMRSVITGGNPLGFGSFNNQSVRASVRPGAIALGETTLAQVPQPLSLKTTPRPDITDLSSDDDLELKSLPDWMSHLPATHRNVRVKNAIGHIEIGEPSGTHYEAVFDPEHNLGPLVDCGTSVGLLRMRWQTLGRTPEGRIAYTIADGWFDIEACQGYEVRRTVIEPSELIPGFAYGYRQDDGRQLVVLAASDQIQSSSASGHATVELRGPLSRVVVPLRRGNAVSIVGSVSDFAHGQWRKLLAIPRVETSNAWTFGIDIMQMVSDEHPTAIGYAAPQKFVPVAMPQFAGVEVPKSAAEFRGSEVDGIDFGDMTELEMETNE